MGGRTRRSRIEVTALTVGGVLLGIAALVWFVLLPHWRPPLGQDEVYGIDVSNHQGPIDWDRVANDGIDFAYIKATEGGDWLDAQFRTNWSAAADAGVLRGPYHFFTLCRPAQEQARWFLSVAPPVPSSLPPAVDLELAGNCSDRPDPAVVNEEVQEFLRIVESAWDRRAILYVGGDYQSVYPLPPRLQRPRWELGFLRRPDVDDLIIWQVHGLAHIEGISGDVDLNLGRLPDLELAG